MNQQKRLKLKKLFFEQDKYEMLKSICEHAKASQPMLFRTSPTNTIKLQDEQLARHILNYAVANLAHVNEEIEKL